MIEELQEQVKDLQDEMRDLREDLRVLQEIVEALGHRQSPNGPPGTLTPGMYPPPPWQAY